MLGRQFDGSDDLDVTGAAAQIKSEGMNDVAPAWMRVGLQKYFGPRQKARCAKTALHSTFGHKCPPKGLAQAFRKALNGDNARAVYLFHGRNTGKGRLGIHLYQTGPAGGLPAAAVFNGNNARSLP